MKKETLDAAIENRRKYKLIRDTHGRRVPVDENKINNVTLTEKIDREGNESTNPFNIDTGWTVLGLVPNLQGNILFILRDAATRVQAEIDKACRVLDDELEQMQDLP